MGGSDDEERTTMPRPKRRKTVPSAKEQQAASVRSLDGVEAPLKPSDVEAAHERREQARAVEDMASHAATASQLERATCRIELRLFTVATFAANLSSANRWTLLDS